MKYIKSTTALILISFALTPVAAQDSLWFDKGNFITGEISSLKQNVLKMETDYSDDDFTIEWAQVNRIITHTYFRIYLKDGSYRYGTLRSESDSLLRITSALGESFVLPKSHFISMGELNPTFKDRFDAGVDIGLNLAKANTLRQLTLDANVGYNAETWNTRASYGSLYSEQEGTEDINRQEFNVSFQLILLRGWTFQPSVNLLKNSEQNLDLRTNLKLGMGKYLIRKNYGYLGAGAGFNRNVETYSNETPDRSSWEGYLGMEVNLFDLDDFSLFSTVMAYPGITERGRWRMDVNMNIKYDLPLDFYIKLDGTLNYDNQPAEGADEYDFVAKIGFGWEW